MDDIVGTAKRSANGQRKEEHLRIALNEDVQFKNVATGLDDYSFVHQALPEINLADVDVSTILLGKSLKAPLVISAMVGGIEAAERINQNLARAAQASGIAMGVGSERCLIDDPDSARTYQVRAVAPDILLFANLGAVQLNYGYGASECLRAVEAIDADALVLHLNPLQEALQPGGNSDFSGLLSKIEGICRVLPVPVLVKEVGCGISENTARQLASAGVSGIDTAGAGGTSWSEIERLRARSETDNNIAAVFASWGIPTARSIQMVKRGAPRMPLIASGGIRNGLDVARAIALGADAAGIATPLLKSANISPEATALAIREIIDVLRITMFCTGAANLGALKNSPFLEKRAGG